VPDYAPKLVAIDQDDYYAKDVGWTVDGRQFFLTTPFVPAVGNSKGAEYVALYIFDTDGRLLDAQIDELGPRDEVDADSARRLIAQKLAALGQTSAGRIQVAPFSVRRFDTEFGLVARAPEENGDPWAVEAQPGNYMAFFEPWDSGEYDT
jgi:hypothetical protein